MSSGQSPAQTNLPERPNEAGDGSNAPSKNALNEAGDGSNAPSKNALKKAAKEKEKAEKAAKRAAEEQAQKEQAAANDTSKHLYGKFSYPNDPPTNPPTLTRLDSLYDAKEDQEVTIVARVDNARVQSSKLAFLVLRKGGHSIQAVVAEGGPNSISRQMVKWCGGLNNETAVRATGLVKQPKEPVTSTTVSNFELHIEKVFVIAGSVEKLPVQYKDCLLPAPIGEGVQEEVNRTDTKDKISTSLEARLNNPVIDKRTPAAHAIFKLESAIKLLFLEYMEKHDFTFITSSKIAGAATEGGAGVFEIKYFDGTATLTQSPQFFKQMAIAMDFERVCEIGQVYRAESSNTHRHLTEFTGIDFEMEFQNHYHEVLEFGENLLLFIIHALQTRPKNIALTKLVHEVYPAPPFKLPSPEKAIRITFAEAISLLNAAGHPCSPLEDLSTPLEKALGKIMLEKYHTDFYTIDKYPLAVRAFYTAPDPSNPLLSNSYDFFMRGQEIMSGAQRINEYEPLCRRMRELGLDPQGEGFRHYTEGFRYGCPVHGGGGVGLNRVVQFWLGLPDIRLATMFPRDPRRKGP